MRRLLADELARSSAPRAIRILYPGAPPVARGERLLSLAVRRGRHPDHRRRRRMGDDDHRPRPWPRHRDRERAALPALGGPALFRVHLLPRIHGEQRRIQADGTGAVRPRRQRARPRRSPTTITRELVDIRPDGSLVLNMAYFEFATGLRMVHEPSWERLFGLPRRAPDVGADAGPHGSGARDPAGHRGDRAAAGAHGAHADRLPPPRAWPAAWRSTAWPTASSSRAASSTTSGFNPRRATPAERWARPTPSGTFTAPRRGPRRTATAAATRWRAATSGRSSPIWTSSGRFARSRRAGRRGGRPRGARHRRRRRAWRRARWAAGSRGAWSSVRARSATAASSATRATPRCRSGST